MAPLVSKSDLLKQEKSMPAEYVRDLKNTLIDLRDMQGPEEAQGDGPHGRARERCRYHEHPAGTAKCV